MTPAGPDPLPPPAGSLAAGTHRYPVRVYHEDTDASGVAYHAAYLRWLERARTELLRLVGIDHAGHLAAGEGGYAVADLAIRYRSPARLDDSLAIETRLTDATPARLRVQQRVSRGGALLAEAAVTAALVGPDGRPRRQPRAWLAIFHGLAAGPSDGSLPTPMLPA